MRAVKGHVTLLAATALALGLAACSSMEGPNALLTQQEAQSVADVVVADAASLADAASYNAASGVPMASAPASATTAPAGPPGPQPPDAPHSRRRPHAHASQDRAGPLHGGRPRLDPVRPPAAEGGLEHRGPPPLTPGEQDVLAAGDDDPAAPLQRGL